MLVKRGMMAEHANVDVTRFLKVMCTVLFPLCYLYAPEGINGETTFINITQGDLTVMEACFCSNNYTECTFYYSPLKLKKTKDTKEVHVMKQNIKLLIGYFECTGIRNGIAPGVKCLRRNRTLELASSDENFTHYTEVASCEVRCIEIFWNGTKVNNLNNKSLERGRCPNETVTSMHPKKSSTSTDTSSFHPKLSSQVPPRNVTSAVSLKSATPVTSLKSPTPVTSQPQTHHCTTWTISIIIISLGTVFMTTGLCVITVVFIKKCHTAKKISHNVSSGQNMNYISLENVNIADENVPISSTNQANISSNRQQLSDQSALLAGEQNSATQIDTLEYTSNTELASDITVTSENQFMKEAGTTNYCCRHRDDGSSIAHPHEVHLSVNQVLPVTTRPATLPVNRLNLQNPENSKHTSIKSQCQPVYSVVNKIKTENKPRVSKTECVFNTHQVRFESNTGSVECDSDKNCGTEDDKSDCYKCIAMEEPGTAGIYSHLGEITSNFTEPYDTILSVEKTCYNKQVECVPENSKL